MLPVSFRKQARTEFDEAGDWYEKERAGLGLEFMVEIQLLIQRIASTPEQFPMLYRDVRKAVSHRFPYCIYFRERNQHIIVLAVFHSARNPATWKQRAG